MLFVEENAKDFVPVGPSGGEGDGRETGGPFYAIVSRLG